MSISYDSELRQLVTAELFEKSYSQFIKQADCNAISKKSEGPRIPYGFTIKKIDGGNWSQHFGQGAASKTLYINWHVVSVYYMPENGNIIIGIEVDRYPFINKMKPIRTAQIGNKKVDIAVFYETTKAKLDYGELYEKFLETSEEVMRLGLG